MEEDIEIHFRPFRRYCMMLTAQPSMPALEKLIELRQNTEPAILQRLQEYIMLPMQMYLRSPSMPENYTISVLKFVQEYYNTVKLTSNFLMKDFLQNILPLLTPNNLQASSDSGSKEKNIRISVSEDMKIALCKCLKNLIRNSDDSVKIDVIYHADFKLPMSHLIFQVLEWCETEDITEVVLVALDLVNELCYEKLISDPTVKSCKDPISVDENVRTNFVLQFAQMLPGITSRLVKVLVPKKSAINDKIQGSAVKARVIMVWCNYICSILNDKNVYKQDGMDIDEGICDTSLADENSSNLLQDVRWIGKAQDHLLTHLQLLSKYNFIVSEKFYLRNIMFLLCEATILNCSKSLKCFNSLQIEILAVLSVDENSTDLARRSKMCLDSIINIKMNRPCEPRERSQNHLDILEEPTENDEILAIVEQTQSRIFEISDSILSSSSGLYEETHLNHLLSQLNGFLVLLKNIEFSSLFFHSETYLGRLLNAILSIIAFEENVLVGDNFTRDYTNFEFILKPELYLKLLRPQKSFKHLSCESSKRRVVSIISVLAKCANISLIIEFLTQKLLFIESDHANIETGETSQRKEVLYLLNEIINEMNSDCINNASERNIREILDSVIEIYLNLKQGTPLHNESSSKIVPSSSINTKTEKDEKANIEWTECCLLIEGLGSLALAYNRNSADDYFKRNHLGEVLVFILSETNLNKSHSAHVLYFSLIDLANANKYQDVPSMLKDNLDYLCRELAILLRRHLSASSKSRRIGLKRPEGLPTLLKAVLVIQDLKCDKVNNLPELRDTVEVLLHQLDLSWIDPDRSITTEILQVINIFTSAFSQHHQNKCSNTTSKVDVNAEKGTLTQLVKDLLKSDDIERQFLEEKMDEHCPETGFHRDEDKMDDASYDTDTENNKVTTDKIKFLKQTVEHTRHFISMVGCPQWQILSLGKVLF